MPLRTYAETRPWAKAIREAVLLHKMPPWFADPRYGSFANDPRLTDAEIQTVKSWADNGAHAGAPATAPSPMIWTAGWSVGVPDIVLSVPKPFTVPAGSEVEYQYFIFPETFKTDRWVRAVEIQPSARALVHHAVLYIREPQDEWLRDAPRGVMFEAPKGDAAAHRRLSETKSDLLAIYTPGSGPSSWAQGLAKKIPAGSELVLQIHYTSARQTAQDRMRVGLIWAPAKPEKRVITLQLGRDDIDIPPGDKDYSLSVSGTMPHDVTLLSLFPHMHLRGSSCEYEIVGPHGYDDTLLLVKPYDFFWQMNYQLRTPRVLPAGTRLRFTGHFDNSPNNPRNPDPTAEVTWGEQSREEMMIGFFDVAVDPDMDKRKLFERAR